MSKQAPIRDTSPKEEEKQKKINVDPNTLWIASTVVIIIFLAITTALSYSLTKSMLQTEIAKIKSSDEITEDDADVMKADEKGILLDLGDFVLNLADTSPRRYLKVNVALELSKTPDEIAHLAAPVKAEGGGHGGGAPAQTPMDAILAEMDQYKPAIRDSVISVLSSKTSDELSTATGKEISKEEIQDLVSSVFNGQREVLRVSFGQFIIQ